jgi:hypothetical protein
MVNMEGQRPVGKSGTTLPRTIDHLGNLSLWQLHKTTFLCSRKVPAAQVLKCYDWAVAMRDAGRCVMLGAHSQLEKDVLHYLLKGTQPVVVVLARGMKKKLEPELAGAVENQRLLLVSTFPSNVTRVTSDTAMARNRFMLEHAQEVTIGMASSTGQLAQLLYKTGRPYHEL